MDISVSRFSPLETSRTFARPLRGDDFGVLRLFHGDPVVMAELGGARDEEKTRDNLHWNLEHWVEHGFGLWVFHSRADESVIALAGFREIEFQNRREIDLAYMLRPGFWGRGFATEITEAVVSCAFLRFGFQTLMAKTRASNRASQRVLEKIGFFLEAEIVDHGAPHLVYHLSREGFGTRAKAKGESREPAPGGSA